MSLYRAKQKERQVREAILDLLAYFATWGLKLDFETLHSYLKVRTSHLAVQRQLSSLMKQGKVKQTGQLYGLTKIKYPSQAKQKKLQTKLLKKARRWSYIFRLIPAVKSVVVINSIAYGNVHERSDIDLFIITIPNRIFITKGILMYGLKILGQLETENDQSAKFSLGKFLTTKGVNLEKDMMAVNEPHLPYWLITGKPVYGADVWYSVLKASPYLLKVLPNYIWPKTSLRVFGTGVRFLDKIDDIGYRKHLRHTASQPKSHTPEAFIRVRPDIINLNHKGTSAQIAKKWQEIRSKI